MLNCLNNNRNQKKDDNEDASVCNSQRQPAQQLLAQHAQQRQEIADLRQQVQQQQHTATQNRDLNEAESILHREIDQGVEWFLIKWWRYEEGADNT